MSDEIDTLEAQLAAERKARDLLQIKVDELTTEIAVEKLRQGLPICACGDSFTSEAMCANCLAGMSFAPSDAQIDALIKEFTADTGIHSMLKEFAFLLLCGSLRAGADEAVDAERGY